MDGVILHSEADTARLARVLATTLRFGEAVGLQGDLGAGKTTLVRRLVVELNGSETHVASPSFALQHEYQVAPDKQFGQKVEHWDLYRLRETPEDLCEPPGGDTLRLIEWPERSPFVMQQLQLLVHMTVGESGQRLVKFSGVRGEEVAKAAQAAFSIG